MGIHSTKHIAADDLIEIQRLMKTTVLAADLKRLQCIYFRGQFDYEVSKIALLTQLSMGHIRRIWTAYFKQGIDALLTKPRGGRRHYLLDEADEEVLLAEHVKDSSEGCILEIDALHQSLCARAGKSVALSTAYRLAHRHGWRKIAPRPFHVTRNSTQSVYFKIFSKSR